jgi:hypothetical protein
MKPRLLVSALTVLTVAFLPIPFAAADDVVYGGIDLWRTPGNGNTGVDFAESPLPAGFFCPGSKAFTGRVVLRGVPVVTAKAGALSATDTIFERLDDARFDGKGLASTRVQARALNLEGVAPVKTACGSYRVQVHLTGNQPVTRMQLVRESSNGGRFLAPLALHVKIVFEPLAKGGRTLEVEKDIRFPANPQLRWSTDLTGQKQFVASVKVDTDGDRIADTILPGTSNFVVRQDRTLPADKADGCEGGVINMPSPDLDPCHCARGCQHCVAGP